MDKESLSSVLACNCEPEIAALIGSIFDIIICCACLIIMAPDIYRFIQHYKDMANSIPTNSDHEQNLKTSKWLFYISTIFFITSWWNMAVSIPPILYTCILSDTDTFLMTTLIWSGLYPFQYYLLLILLFIRLYHTFEGTMFKLSQRTLNIFKFAFIFQGCNCSIALSIFIVNAYYGLLLISFSFLVIIALTAAILFLYIKRLMYVYKQVTSCQDSDEELVRLATKTPILSVTSILNSFGAMSVTLLWSMFDGYTLWIGHLVVMLDIYINYLCILMGYKHFNKYYVILCGCCDRKCRNIAIGYRTDPVNIATNMKDVDGSTTNDTATQQSSSKSGP